MLEDALGVPTGDMDVLGVSPRVTSATASSTEHRKTKQKCNKQKSSLREVGQRHATA